MKEEMKERKEMKERNRGLLKGFVGATIAAVMMPVTAKAKSLYIDKLFPFIPQIGIENKGGRI